MDEEALSPAGRGEQQPAPAICDRPAFDRAYAAPGGIHVAPRLFTLVNGMRATRLPGRKQASMSVLAAALTVLESPTGRRTASFPARSAERGQPARSMSRFQVDTGTVLRRGIGMRSLAEIDSVLNICMPAISL